MERRTIEAYNKILAEEKAQAEAAVASVTAAADALKLNNVNRFAPNKTEPLQPQRTDLPPAATEDGPLRPVTPASVAEPSASGSTPTPGTVVVAPAVVKDFDVPKDDPFDVAELNTINEIEELRDVLATFETPKNVISPELSNPQRNSPHEDGAAAEVVPSPVVQPPPDDLHTSPSLPGIANGSLDQTTKHKFGSLKDITFPRLCPAQDRILFDPKKSLNPPTLSQVASSAPSSQADLRAFGESANTNQTPQCSLNSELRSQQLAEISAGLMNRSNSPSVENYYSPETTNSFEFFYRLRITPPSPEEFYVRILP
ncbi:unnamed protein product [Dibothriocephalus latus]|uniref:Uncharacterized protein n=1 Tax=Dibothriocephalus latus TaxID=60516 RepID=A0A3P7PMD9_DIBLA|nr:unnamed protein product [Dibothriocephalus latus]